MAAKVSAGGSKSRCQNPGIYCRRFALSAYVALARSGQSACASCITCGNVASLGSPSPDFPRILRDAGPRKAWMVVHQRTASHDTGDHQPDEQRDSDGQES